MMAFSCIPCGRVGYEDECPGYLEWPDANRLKRGEITHEQAASIAVAVHKSNSRRFEREMAEASAARQRNAAGMASSPRCKECQSAL